MRDDDALVAELTQRFARVYRGPSEELEAYLRGVVDGVRGVLAAGGTTPDPDPVMMRLTAVRYRRMAHLIERHGMDIARAVLEAVDPARWS